MKKVLFVIGGVIGVFVLALVSGFTPDLQPKVDVLKEIAGPPPDSLDNLFPPKAAAPVYLIEMFNLAAPFEGVGVDLQEQDITGVKANYQAFKAQYDKVAGMVPEWKSRFPKEPVDALGQAIDSGDPAKVGPAMGKTGEVCSSCHLLYQVKVQQKYHWPNFDDIKLTDPVTNQSLAFVDYMTAMAGAYSGIATDLQEGQLDNARKNFQAFSARFKALAVPTSGCATKGCHDAQPFKPRAYFVDDSMQAMVDQLGQALESPAPNSQTVQQLSGAIGNESCLKCHLVHFPAQYSKDTWEQFKDILK
jgi:hypothetical protein